MPRWRTHFLIWWEEQNEGHALSKLEHIVNIYTKILSLRQKKTDRDRRLKEMIFKKI